MDLQKTHLIVGISGGSASGKTTFARELKRVLGEKLCAIVYQDSYYLDHGKLVVKCGEDINFDHPDAIEFSLLAQHLKFLRQGHSVPVPDYDFVTHTRKADFQVQVPKPVILIDGILILSRPEIRELLDYSIFIKTTEEVRFKRRLARDVAERGRTPEGVSRQFEKYVKPMHDLFVEPSQQYADKVFRGEGSMRGPLIETLELFGYSSRVEVPKGV